MTSEIDGSKKVSTLEKSTKCSEYYQHYLPITLNKRSFTAKESEEIIKGSSNKYK